MNRAGKVVWRDWEHVLLSADAEYAVRLTGDGCHEVFRIIDRPPVSRRGFYQIERVWRRIRPNGPTGLRVFHLASEAVNARHAIANAEERTP
jgi:hypothetical protein